MSDIVSVGVSDPPATLDREIARTCERSSAAQTSIFSIDDRLRIAALKAASPIDHVDAGTPAILPMHGPEDAVGPIKQSRAIEKRLKAAGKKAAGKDVRFGC